MSGSSFAFGTVLLARESTESPSEIEIKLRSKAQKLRIVNSLAGRADLLLPLTGGITIAVRYYDQQRMQRLQSMVVLADGDANNNNNNDDNNDNKQDTTATCTAAVAETEMKSETETIASSNSIESQNQDFDGITSFANAFKHSIVIFIQSQNQLRQQLQQSDSILYKLQRSLTLTPLSLSTQSSTSSSSSTDKHNSRNKSRQLKGCAQIFIVPDYFSFLNTVSSIQESLSPSKIKLKQDFFQYEASRQLIPDGYANDDDNDDYDPNAPSMSLEPRLVKQVVRKVFQEWAMKRGIDIHDANVVMDAMGSLEKIAKSGCRSQKDGLGLGLDDGLESVPVEKSVKALIRDFFGGSTCSDGNDNINDNVNDNGNVDVDANVDANVDGMNQNVDGRLSRVDNGHSSQHRDIPQNAFFGKQQWNGNSQNRVGRRAGEDVGVRDRDGQTEHVNLAGSNNQYQHQRYEEDDGQFAYDAGGAEYSTSFADSAMEVNHYLRDHRSQSQSRRILLSQGQISGTCNGNGARRQQMQMPYSSSPAVFEQDSDLQLSMSMQSDCSDDPRVRYDLSRQQGYPPHHPSNYFRQNHYSTPSLTPASVSRHPTKQPMTPRHPNVEIRRQTPLQMQHHQMNNNNRRASFRTPQQNSYMNTQQSTRSVRQRTIRQGRFNSRGQSTPGRTIHREEGRVRGNLQEDIHQNPFQDFNYQA